MREYGCLFWTSRSSYMTIGADMYPTCRLGSNLTPAAWQTKVVLF